MIMMVAEEEEYVLNYQWKWKKKPFCLGRWEMKIVNVSIRHIL